ncbi:hypothetical protein K504DRAFT_461591 [Pleomassaria siparia CBS 279.74]|uniref:Rhodopsin domain-containing protein n=1 Tax=Pleomassaria siparia CBS 279.74 TaxID=1314801 RepID=A0A6G1KKJ2_9PLEO|nr:hypothetical protein K504DRAFT_461591 [Pleomassaria siparia CBS 279.74]
MGNLLTLVSGPHSNLHSTLSGCTTNKSVCSQDRYGTATAHLAYIGCSFVAELKLEYKYPHPTSTVMSGMASSTDAPTSVGNRFARFTPDDHSAPIWIATILALIFAYLILLIRLLFVKKNRYGIDDVLLTLAHIMGLGMWAAIFSSLGSGLGKALKLVQAKDIPRMNQAYLASRILLLLALGISKCSVLMFVRGIFDHSTRVVLVVHVTIGIVVAWGLAGALAVSVGTSPDKIADGLNFAHATNDILRLKVITIIDIVTEIVILLLPIVPLFKIQMSWQRKLIVIIAFSFRILNIYITLMHLFSYTEFVHKKGTGVSIAAPVVWQNVLLSYNFMSATIPTLKGFVAAFLTGGIAYSGDISSSGGIGGSCENRNSYRMLSLSKKGNTSTGLLPEGYPESTAFVTSIPAEGLSKTVRRPREGSRGNVTDNESIASYESQQIIIRKDWGISRV